MPANKEKPLIIPPTSQGRGTQFIEARVQNATQLREAHPIRFDAEDDFDVIANLYNEYYGKMALNLPDVIADVSKRRLTQAIKANSLPFSEEDVAQLTSHIVSQGFRNEYRELEVAFDYYVRQFPDQETYQKFITEGESDFAHIAQTITSQYSLEIRECILTLCQNYHLSFDDIFTLLKPVIDKIPLEAMQKEYARNQRKIAEIRFLLELFSTDPDFSNATDIVDMAGGAGDLGVSLADSNPMMQVRVIDVIPTLEQYNGYLKNNGLLSSTADRVQFELHPLQETTFSSDVTRTAIVSKHPCGGLKEDVASVAIENNIPLVMIMTCCQEKMANHAEEYFPYYQSDVIPDLDTFVQLCRDSGYTNIDLSAHPPEKRQKLQAKHEQGLQAMNSLDQATMRRFQAAGYQVSLERAPEGIHKGNVIIAKKPVLSKLV